MEKLQKFLVYEYVETHTKFCYKIIKLNSVQSSSNSAIHFERAKENKIEKAYFMPISYTMFMRFVLNWFQYKINAISMRDVSLLIKVKIKTQTIIT